MVATLLARRPGLPGPGGNPLAQHDQLVAVGSTGLSSGLAMCQPLRPSLAFASAVLGRTMFANAALVALEKYRP